MRVELEKYVLLKNGRILNTVDNDHVHHLSTFGQNVLSVVRDDGVIIGEFLATTDDLDVIVLKRREYMERETKWLGDFVPGTKYVFCAGGDEKRRVYLVFENMDDRKEAQARAMNALLRLGYRLMSSTEPEPTNK